MLLKTIDTAKENMYMSLNKQAIVVPSPEMTGGGGNKPDYPEAELKCKDFRLQPRGRPSRNSSVLLTLFFLLQVALRWFSSLEA